MSEEKKQKQSRKKDWKTLTKIHTYIVDAIFVCVFVFSIWAVVHFQAPDLLQILIPSTEAVVAIVLNSYFRKSRFEYKVNKMVEVIIYLSNKGIEVNAEMLEAMNLKD